MPPTPRVEAASGLALAHVSPILADKRAPTPTPIPTPTLTRPLVLVIEAVAARLVGVGIAAATNAPRHPRPQTLRRREESTTPIQAAPVSLQPVATEPMVAYMQTSAPERTTPSSGEIGAAVDSRRRRNRLEGSGWVSCRRRLTARYRRCRCPRQSQTSRGWMGGAPRGIGRLAGMHSLRKRTGRCTHMPCLWRPSQVTT